jgi:hypothetical protein
VSLFGINRFGVGAPIATAWIGTTDVADVSSPSSKWLMTVSGLGGPLAVYVKSGVFSGSNPGVRAQIDIRAYISNEGSGVGSVVNPACTVPYFESNGEYLFKRNSSGNDLPAKQYCQGRREFYSKLLSIPTVGTMRYQIFGGPWVGNMTWVANSGSLLAEASGMDAEPTVASGGVLLDTVTAQRGRVEVVDPMRYNQTQFSLVAQSPPQSADVRFGLTSPSR